MYRAIRTPDGLERCRDIKRSDPDNALVESWEAEVVCEQTAD
jgi:hypothetical protein